MKPLAGGAIEDATLALRYVCSNPDVTVVMPGMAEVHELDENIKACSNTEPLTEEELAKMDKIREQLGNDFAVAAIIVHLVQSVSIFRASSFLRVICRDMTSQTGRKIDTAHCR